MGEVNVGKMLCAIVKNNHHFPDPSKYKCNDHILLILPFLVRGSSLCRKKEKTRMFY